MTRTRVLAALVMAPAAIAAIVLLSTPWLAALAALVLLMGLWEWLKLAGVEDTLPRIVLVGLNLSLMVLLVWASRDAAGINPALFQIVTLVGALAWLLAQRPSVWWASARRWSSAGRGVQPQQLDGLGQHHFWATHCETRQ